MSYRIEKKLVHGEWVSVKVYLPSRRGSNQKMKVRGTDQRGALHAAKDSGKKLEGIYERL